MDHSGTITKDECLAKLRSINLGGNYKISEEDVHHFIQKVDINNSGEINYSQFLVATLTPEHFSPTNVRNLFDFLDNHE